MTGFAAWELQTAIFNALNTDTALLARVSGVFDKVPSGTAFPYVVIGDSKAKDWSSKTFNGQEHTFQVEVFSQTGGRMEMKEVMALAYDAILGQTLTVAGNELVNLLHTDSDDVLDKDGITYHGTLRFRAVTKQI